MNFHANVQRSAALIVQLLVRIRISWKPVTPVDMFAIGFNYAELVLLRLRNSLTLRFHDKQILIVNPYPAYKQSLLCLLWIGYDLGSYVKDVEIQLVDLFFTDILEIVLRDLRGLKSKRIYSTQVVDIFRGDLGHCGHREKTNLLEAITLIVKSEGRDSMVLADDLPAHTEALNQRIALE